MKRDATIPTPALQKDAGYPAEVISSYTQLAHIVPEITAQIPPEEIFTKTLTNTVSAPCGRLSRFYETWKKVTTDPLLLSWIKGYSLLFKKLNKFLQLPHFKLEDYRTASKLITRGAYMAILDLKDAYHLVAIKPSHRKYLRFEFEGTLYEYLCLSFGLCTAPFVFTKLLKPILTLLRGTGYKSVVYLDDFLLISPDSFSCAQNVAVTAWLLLRLGFLFSKKCKPRPHQRCQYLGFVFDSNTMTLSLPQERITAISRLVKRMKSKRYTKIRDFAKFLGSLGACCPSVPHAWVYTKSFEREKT